MRQGCQMACFQTKNPNFGNFWGYCNERYWYILWPFGLSYGHYVFMWPFGVLNGHLVYSFRFGKLCQEKSGIPGMRAKSSVD
jgi:hypothetical protein